METLRELVARVLGIDGEEINDDSSPENISSWDSFNGLMLVLELETNFKVKFSVDDVMDVKNFKDIKGVLKRYNITEGVDD